MSVCSQCGFELWRPIAELEVADLGLYSDERFPGRCILKLREHRERLEELPEELLLAFHRDLRRASEAIRSVTGSQRVNFAVLGNTVPHLHGHLIPRIPENEPKPGSSPWDDPRPRVTLLGSEAKRIVAELQAILGSSS